MRLFEAFHIIKREVKDNIAWALLDFFALLAILAVLGSGITVSMWLIPVITSALAFALLPQFMLTLIALLPLIVSVALLLQFLKNNWLIVLDDYNSKDSYLIPVYLLFQLGAAPFMFFKFRNLQNGFKSTTLAEKGLYLDPILIYLACATLASVGLGIYLSVMILPTLFSAMIGLTGASSVLAGLFSVLVAASLITLTQSLLTLPLELANIGLNFLEWKKAQYKDLLFHVVQALFTATGTALAGYACYFIFPMIVASLLPLLPQATTVFTAVAICVGLVALTINTLPIVMDLLAGTLRFIANKGRDRKPSGLTISFKELEVDLRSLMLKSGEILDLKEEFDEDYRGWQYIAQKSSIPPVSPHTKY